MNIFDMRTMLLAGVFSNIISSSVFIGFWISVRKRYQGMGLIAASFSLYTIGWLLVALRGGLLPDLITMTVANTLMVAGAFLGYLGLERFVNKRSRQTVNLLILGLFPLVHAYFLFIQPNMNLRGIILFCCLAIILGQSMILLLIRVEKFNRYFTRMTGSVFAALVLVCLLRAWQLLYFPSPAADFLKTGDLDALFMTALLMLTLLLTFSIMMMVNQRLIGTIGEQEEKYAKVFFHAPYGIVLKRQSDDKIIEVNDGFTGITGYQNDEVVGKPSAEILCWKNEQDYQLASQELLETGRIKEKETLLQTREGQAFTGLYSAETISVNGEEVILSVINDITARKQAEEQIKHLANHDALTDLPSLRLIQDQFGMAMKLARRNSEKIAVMFVDLDSFKTINDTFGHQLGDHLLQQVARRLSEVARKADTVARIGGDEFLLIVTAFEDPAMPGQMAQRVLDAITQPMELDARVIQISASIGISLYPDDGDDLDGLIKLADDAMYRIKKAGKNGFAYSRAEMSR